ncbi:hypothetical protein AB6A40_010281 [Gnathostoma spinigerum]|uniref:Uncharacterized protein n=1 Tax=Gnathostoma spinigerum TaxID=75299 RepID=A0ABD6F2F0_9BILA
MFAVPIAMGHDRNSDSDLLKRSRGPYQQGWSTASVTTASSLVFLLCAAFSMLIMKMQQPGCDRKPYNYSLLGSPLVLDDGSLLYNVVVVTDLDHDSKDDSKKNTWRSILKAGSITLKKDLKSASVIWDDGKEVCFCSYMF